MYPGGSHPNSSSTPICLHQRIIILLLPQFFFFPSPSSSPLLRLPIFIPSTFLSLLFSLTLLLHQLVTFVNISPTSTSSTLILIHPHQLRYLHNVSSSPQFYSSIIFVVPTSSPTFINPSPARRNTLSAASSMSSHLIPITFPIKHRLHNSINSSSSSSLTCLHLRYPH